jgi:hypothetical protein
MSEEISYVGQTTGDAFLDVQFYKRIHNGQEEDFIRINVPGDKTVSIDTIAEEHHKLRFSRHWQQYENLQKIDGHPIAEWEEIPETLRTDLVYQGFKFVEQLAQAPDSSLMRIAGGTTYRLKAQAFLNRGKRNADEMIDTLVSQNQELTEKLELLMAELNKPKRGKAVEE